jgi:short-subunit dehydrogenase
MKIDSNKKIWITGASSGIGEQLAYKLAEYKPTLVLSARNYDKLKEVAGKCKELGANTVVVPIDLSDSTSIANAFKIVENHLGDIDILINNAGVSQRSTVSETSMEVYRKLMEINFFGTVELTKLVLPAMFKRKSGHIVTVTSLAGKVGFPLRSAYGASKFALHGFFETLMTEVSEYNIKVTLAVPSHIKTNIAHSALRGDGKPYGKPDSAIENGLSAEKCARKIVKAIEKNKSEVRILGKDILGYWIYKISPNAFRFIVKKLKLK